MAQPPEYSPSLKREVFFLIHQFFQDENLKETIHKLEQESGFFFDMNHFKILFLDGEWDEVEKYLSGFTKVHDNKYSRRIYFEIRKQKYLEAIDMEERAKAVEILVNDLKVFKTSDEELFKEMTQLVTIKNIRDHKPLSTYRNAKWARAAMFTEVEKLIKKNTLLRDKLQFPTVNKSRLLTLLNGCEKSKTTLFNYPNFSPSINTLMHQQAPHPGLMGNPSPLSYPAVPGGFSQFVGNQLFQPPPHAGWMGNPSPLSYPAVPLGNFSLPTPLNSAAPLMRLRNPSTSNPTADHQLADSEQVVMKRSQQTGISDEVGTPTAYMSVGSSSAEVHMHVPKIVAMTLDVGSAVKSMDFHPCQSTLLLVGTSDGDTAVLELVSREWLALRKFQVWDLQACSLHLQEFLAKNPAIAVNRVMWSPPDGRQVGVAYSKHIVHLYTYNGGASDKLIHHLEIEAHAGGVNDLAFSKINDQMFIVTCGDDKAVKVWDAVTGVVRYNFECHKAPVYSVCPHSRGDYQFILSTSVDGKMKVWSYEKGDINSDYNAPHHCRARIAYSADGTRLFSCGTNKDGDSYLVEWNESEGSIKRTYHGLDKHSMGGVAQFDTAKNRFLAAADEFKITFWEMDIAVPLAMTDAEGRLAASPCIRYNKVGSLLAVTTNDNCIKILANADGIHMLLSNENLPDHNASKAISETAAQWFTLGERL